MDCGIPLIWVSSYISLSADTYTRFIQQRDGVRVEVLLVSERFDDLPVWVAMARIPGGDANEVLLPHQQLRLHRSAHQFVQWRTGRK